MLLAPRAAVRPTPCSRVLRCEATCAEAGLAGPSYTRRSWPGTATRSLSALLLPCANFDDTSLVREASSAPRHNCDGLCTVPRVEDCRHRQCVPRRAPGSLLVTPTKILIDARSLSNDSAARGIGRYATEILTGLASADDLSLTAFTSGDVELDRRVARRPVHRLMTGRLASLEDRLRLPRDIARTGGDVYFSPDYAPPRRCNIPWVQTIYDVTPLLIDDPLFGPARRQLARLAPRFRAADAVIAISGDSADQAVTKLGIARNRITVIHLAAAPEFQPGPAPSTSPRRISSSSASGDRTRVSAKPSRSSRNSPVPRCRIGS